MTVELLLHEMDRVIQDKHAISHLRQFMLDLALRGQLVHQDPGDLGNELLAAIQRRRGPGSTSGPRSAALQTLPSGDRRQYPGNWAWTTLSEVCRSVTDGDHQPPPKQPSGVPFLVIGNVRSGRITFDDCRYVSTDYFNRLDQAHRPQSGDVLYTLVGSYGIAIAVDGDREFCVQRHIGILRPEPELAPSYLRYALTSTMARDQAANCATGIAQKTVSLRGLRTMQIPLPPLAEQYRIVAKVDEVMGLCNELEATQNDREVQRDRLRWTSLRKLVAPESRDSARFFLQHSPRTITKPEHVAGVREVILDLAVRGRLVAQDANEWREETLASVCEFIVDGDHNPPVRHSHGIPHLTAKHIINDRINTGGCTFLSEDDFTIRSKRYLPRGGDVILTCVGSLGRTAIVPDGLVFSADRNLAALRPVNGAITSRFLKLAIDSPNTQRQLTTASGQTAQPHIYLKDIRAQRVSLPLLAEQHCIVAKVDELMAVCDELERSLVAEETERGRLLQALLHAALAARTLGSNNSSIRDALEEDAPNKMDSAMV